jgi:hypothetical protein
MNDDDMLATMRSSLTGVKDSLTGVHMDRPAEAIAARARGRRLRRGLTGVGAAGAALGVSLALALSAGPAAARPVHVNLDAWSVNTTASGTVKVKIREFLHPAELRQTLAEAGVPAVVFFGAACYPEGSPEVPVLDFRKAISYQNTRTSTTITIRPADIPAGAEVEISVDVTRDKHSGETAIRDAGVGLTWIHARQVCYSSKELDGILGTSGTPLTPAR